MGPIGNRLGKDRQSSEQHLGEGYLLSESEGGDRKCRLDSRLAPCLAVRTALLLHITLSLVHYGLVIGCNEAMLSLAQIEAAEQVV